MKHLLTNDIEGADWERIVANEADDTVYMKDFDFKYIAKPVDLGLDSGTLWADRNIGAAYQEDGGLYFQWGDTIGYSKEQVGVDKNFNEIDYDNELANKYKVDKETTLDLKDDAAHVIMGGDWRLPTNDEISELFTLNYTIVYQRRENVSSLWGVKQEWSQNDINTNKQLILSNISVDDNGNVNEANSKIRFLGFKFLGKKNNDLFITVSGMGSNKHISSYGDIFTLRSSTLLEKDSLLYSTVGGGEILEGIEVANVPLFLWYNCCGVISTNK